MGKKSECYVYRCYDTAGVLLYVGMTGSVPGRVSQHRQSGGWSDRIARVDQSGPMSRKAAAALEAKQIAELAPEFNRRVPIVPSKKLMSGPMTKTKATILAGSQAALAKILGISPQAVSRWPDDSIPELQMYRLRERKPRWFSVARKLTDQQEQSQQEQQLEAA